MAKLNPPRKIRLLRLAHVYYTHVDIELANRFLLDFGLRETEKRDHKTYYRGYGTEPFLYCASAGDTTAFGGVAFEVESFHDLQLASDTLPNATAIHDLDAPGGGKRVTFYDPVDGFPFHLVYGQQPVEPSADYPELPFNFPRNKHRPVSTFKRLQPGPAPVHKLGHVGCCVTDFSTTFDFYTTHFNFKPSDIVYEGEKDVTTFLHLDRGVEHVDHHSFFFFEGPQFHVHHSSFEVHDFDVQALGHEWLRGKGYDLVWGVGRHVLGSQIFDYW